MNLYEKIVETTDRVKQCEKAIEEEQIKIDKLNEELGVILEPIIMEYLEIRKEIEDKERSGALEKGYRSFWERLLSLLKSRRYYFKTAYIYKESAHCLFVASADDELEETVRLPKEALINSKAWLNTIREEAQEKRR